MDYTQSIVNFSYRQYLSNAREVGVFRFQFSFVFWVFRLQGRVGVICFWVQRIQGKQGVYVIVGFGLVVFFKRLVICFERSSVLFRVVDFNFFFVKFFSMKIQRSGVGDDCRFREGVEENVSFVVFEFRIVILRRRE